MDNKELKERPFTSPGKRIEDIWKAIIAGAEVPETKIDLWLASCLPIEIDENTGELVVDATNSFTRSYITQNFLRQLNESAAKTGVVKAVRLEVNLQDPAHDQSKKTDAVQQDDLDWQMNLNPAYTFESFVVGRSNRMAHAASLAVAEMPGAAYNPLFIWGGVGLGKTHLMHAICHYALARSPDLRILYLNSETFLNEFIKAISSSRMAQFKERFRNVDILLIDDIQFLGNKEQSQEEFFFTFNTLHEGNKQVVICSDRQPSELKGIEDRLTSRFSSGLVTDIQPPDFETRIAILQKKAMLRDCKIPDDVIRFMARHIAGNIRKLEGALTRVIACAENYGEKINIDRTEEWLRDVIRSDTKENVAIGGIQEVVAREFELSFGDLESSRRTAELALARQIAMYLAREMTDLSLQQIAGAFGRKDHTTVIHAWQKIRKMIKEDDNFRKRIDELMGQCLK